VAPSFSPENNHWQKCLVVFGPANTNSFFPHAWQILSLSTPWSMHFKHTHQCYMLPVDYNDRQKKHTYIFFDFECTQDDRIQCQQGYQSDDNETCIHCKSPKCGAFEHKPNLCVVLDTGSCHLGYIQNRKRCKSVSSVYRCNPQVACNTVQLHVRT
jgi:hypothetical protein